MLIARNLRACCERPEARVANGEVGETPDLSLAICYSPFAFFSLLHRSVLRRPGGYSEEPLPDPIPNSAVKVLCADGTKPQGLEE